MKIRELIDLAYIELKDSNFNFKNITREDVKKILSYATAGIRLARQNDSLKKELATERMNRERAEKRFRHRIIALNCDRIELRNRFNNIEKIYKKFTREVLENE